MNDRYYSVQFTDPLKNTNFAYVGTRTTGSHAGDYLISGPGWKGQAPAGMKPITSPKNSVLIIGRVLVESDSDVSTAYDSFEADTTDAIEPMETRAAIIGKKEHRI